MTRKLLTIFAVVALIATLGASSVLANIPGSTFEGGDGNLAVDTVGNTDWTNVTNLTTASRPRHRRGRQLVRPGHVGERRQHPRRDRLDPEQQGRPWPVRIGVPVHRRQPVPPAGVDPRTTCRARPTSTSRSTRLPQPDLTTVGDKTLVRTAGDLLVTYDFLGGAQKPTLNIRTWTGTVWGPATADQRDRRRGRGQSRRLRQHRLHRWRHRACLRLRRGQHQPDRSGRGPGECLRGLLVHLREVPLV